MIFRHAIFLVVGLVALLSSGLPWLGFGPHGFTLPGTSILLPTWNLTTRNPGPIESWFRLYYYCLEKPVYLIGVWGQNTFIENVVFRPGVIPFIAFVFWLLVGIAFLWISIRPVVFPNAYGHLRKLAASSGPHEFRTTTNLDIRGRPEFVGLNQLADEPHGMLCRRNWH
ncbi:MAG: hypothetical protein CMJ78_25765 [Planctomycetaceae bacterium]|nr:hypothetical protein [Planctomycetaceae bacterium]